MTSKLSVVLLALVVVLLAACGGRAAPGVAQPAATTETHDGMAMGEGAMTDLAALEGAAFEIAFMQAMIPHHQSATEMAQIALERAQRAETRSVAQAIIAAQQAEIEQMTAWLQAWHNTTPAGMDHTMMMAAEEMEQLRAIAPEEFDAAFLGAMIPHHEGAIEMAALVAERTDRPELNALADAIQTTQRAEIEQFNEWLAAWGAEGN